MSADSLAVLRKNVGEDISKLAEEHLKHDLQESDRDTLKTAANKISTHASIGSLLGLGLGLFLAFRIRSSRTQMFNAFRTAEKPTHVKFADGREGTYDHVAASPFIQPCSTFIHHPIRDRAARGRLAPIVPRAYLRGLYIEAIPNVVPLLKPTTLGDIAAYFFFSAGGLFVGGETGLLTGSASASRTINRDPNSRARIEAAFKKFRADILRKEADDLDGGRGVAGVLGF